MKYLILFLIQALSAFAIIHFFTHDGKVKIDKINGNPSLKFVIIILFAIGLFINYYICDYILNDLDF